MLCTIITLNMDVVLMGKKLALVVISIGRTVNHEESIEIDLINV